MNELILTYKKGPAFYINRLCLSLLLSLVLSVVSISFFFSLCPVSQGSMTPTILDGQYVLLNKHDSQYSNGEIIVFNKYGKKNLIKRVIAREGDTIEFRPNPASYYGFDSYGEVFVYLNGVKLEENYINGPMKSDFPVQGGKFLDLNTELTLGRGEYFCMGDNRNVSLDSRSRLLDGSGSEFGLVKEHEIIGSLAYIIPQDTIIEWFLRVFYREYFTKKD